MSSNANNFDNWAGALPQPGLATSWRQPGDLAVQQPLAADELIYQLRGPGALVSTGLLLLGICALFLLPRAMYIVGGSQTEGVVIKIAERLGPRGTMYAPVVAYVVDGEEYAVASSQSSSWNTYRVGDALPVLYFASDPAKATIGGFQQLYLMPCVFGVPSLVLISAGVAYGVCVVRKSGWRLLPA